MQISSSISSKRLVRRRKLGATATSTVDPRVTLACRLGCHIAAERLAERAAALREAGR